MGAGVISDNAKRVRLITFFCSLLMFFGASSFAGQLYSEDDSESYISTINDGQSFVLVARGFSSPLCMSKKEFPGVAVALHRLQHDIKSVTGLKPMIVTDGLPPARELILVGTIGKNMLIDSLIRAGKLTAQNIAGKWESFVLQVVDHPFPSVDRALIIAGSDKRGTIFGIYDLSEHIGVSPWYWWADLPPEHKAAVYVKHGTYAQGPPSVKYRGIFLNDEFPDLTNWVKQKFGTIPVKKDPPIPTGIANYNHLFYEKIFELILRLKGNYLWPAMWNNAFNEDDPENPKLADEYGIVMGTSHQEPMLRAQKEWDRRYLSTIGTWNYNKYPDTLEDFWRYGVRRNKKYESIITLGLRGANDTPMAPGGPETNMRLLEKIVGVQRKILSEEMNPDVSKVPQLWCLYKEVQDFYNAGMRVPDDVTLLWAEDNWGNIRRLPTREERQRAGGAGIYYHFDYHGSPRNYQWINTNSIAKIWDQMSLAKQYGADRIWIVNVGHFKGYEFPLEYFMRLAWDSGSRLNNNVLEFTHWWAQREFGGRYAGDIADILSRYTRYNARRKPELLDPATYSLVNYHEAETVVADFNEIAAKAQKIYSKLPEAKRNAFYELVLFPAKAGALVNQLYVTAGKNYLYAKQGRASANTMAAETRKLFRKDTSLMGYFNREFAGRKWNHFMDQTHLGYTTWNDPPSNSLRAIRLLEIHPQSAASMGVSVEGSEEAWPADSGAAVLPPFDAWNRQRRSIDVFNKGKKPFQFNANVSAAWIVLNTTKESVKQDRRLWVSVDWKKVSGGTSKGTVSVTGAGSTVIVHIEALHPQNIALDSLNGFVESEKLVSMEAEHYTKKIDEGSNRWMKIEDYGHTLSAMRAASEADAPPAIPGKDSPCLEYAMLLFHAGSIDVETICAPTLNFIPGRALRYAVSFDDAVPQIVTLVPANYSAQNGNADWENSVSMNARHSYSTHNLPAPGKHILKIWMIDPGVVVEKIVVNLGGVKSSYLGPPESYFTKGKK